MLLLEGKLVLITGASRGIGRATAIECARHGADLVLCSRTGEETLSSLKAELEKQFQRKVYVYKADVSDHEAVAEMFKQLSQEKLYIDVLVNNAGIMLESVLQMTKPGAIEDTFKTNVYGSMYASQQAIKHMLRKRQGSIINLSSILGINGSIGQSVYGASKAAIVGFTKSLSKEVAPLQIRVNAIAPGFIETDMTGNMDQRSHEKTLSAIGMKRPGTPQDVARVVVFLASELSAYVTGQVIGVDGSMVV